MEDAIEIEPRHAAKARSHQLVALADAQEGNVERGQMLALGFTRHEVRRMLTNGLLVPRYRGVYSLGRRKLTRRGMWMAAVLAAGEAAVLSHRSAARLWGLRVGEKETEVTAANGRRREGIVIHRAVLPPDEVTVRDGIPVTTAARTLLDLAAVETPPVIERAINEAERLRLSDATPLSDLLDRYPRRPGTPAVKNILARMNGGVTVTRSELEDRFLELIRGAGLPPPQTNTLIEGFEVDCAWPAQRLVAELDGHAFHATRESFESDRARDRALQRAGWRVIRITYRQLREKAGALAEDLRALLGR